MQQAAGAPLRPLTNEFRNTRRPPFNFSQFAAMLSQQMTTTTDVVQGAGMAIDREQADELLTTTRAVRRRMNFDRAVERKVVEECVRIALQAPVGSPAWKQHFIVLMDAQKRLQIADIYRKGTYPYLDSREQAAVDIEETDPGEAALIRKNLASAKWHADTFHQVPCMVILAKEGRVEGQDAFTQAAFYGSIMPAAWSFMLALRARGLGACWTNLHMVYESEVSSLLGIPADVTHPVLFTVGYYKGETFKPATRIPASEQLHWDGW